MPKPIIEVENLSKLYRLGIIGSTTLRDSVERWWYRARGREEMCQKIGAKHLMIEPDDPQAGPEPNTLWALRDVSFSVKQGEVLGIIGKNGAGKSTLLKILSRITEPTSGRAIIRGRISSMLEVGTGFHPELTGRENVYLNGAILGMRKTEINRKFDEIVDFSGVEKFIDTPVKRYSSGMYVRLAFAVAAHLEPEILLVDEVLAVGDIAFQKKCLGKMGDIAKCGRTVLFVSHNMGAIKQLCDKSILLNNGKIQNKGITSDIIDEYLSEVNTLIIKTPLVQRRDRKGNGNLRFTEVTFENFFGGGLEYLSSGEDTKIILDYTCNVNKMLTNVLVSIEIIANGERFIHFDTYFTNQNFESIPARGQIICNIPKLPLLPGTYFLNLYSTSNMIETDWIENAISFHVKSGTFFKSKSVPPNFAARILVDHYWNLREL